MPGLAERFLEAATAPLGDNAELQVMARRELEECLVAGDTEALVDATETLEKKKPRRGWKIALYAVTAAVSMISLGLSARMAPTIDGVRTALSSRVILGRLPDPGKPEALLGKGLSAEQRQLLMGDTSQANPGERFKALWNSDPGNPAYFAEYSIHFFKDHSRLPPDFLETAAKLDPDNSWFTLWAAAAVAKNAARQKPSGPTHLKKVVLPGFWVDQARLDEVVKLLEKAANQPRFDSYQAHLTAERIRLLPDRTDLASQVTPLNFMANWPSYLTTFLDFSKVVEAAAWSAEQNRDVDGFRKLSASWERCLELLVRGESGVLIERTIQEIAVSQTSQRFSQTARTLGLSEEMKKWESRQERLESIYSERLKLDRGDWIKLRGSILAGLAIPDLSSRTARAPEITDADLKPGRMADHELFSRISAAVVWLVFSMILLAAALYRQRASLLVRRLSSRLEHLLKPADWAWILGAGVVLPFLFYLVIYRLTPLGARDWSIAASVFMVPSGQVAAMGFLMIVLPVMIARWRLGKRGAMLGWQKGRPRLGWSAVICGALSLLVFGLSFANGKGSETLMIIAAALLGILVLTWLAIGIRAVFSKRPALLRRVTVSRVLVPAYAVGMLLMAASMPLYHAAEKRWLAQDRLMEITPEAPALSRYEWEVDLAKQAELLEILGAK